MTNTILIVDKKNEEIILRQKTAPFVFSRFTKKEIRALVSMMRGSMKAADGVGLSANQIGLNLSVFVAQVERKLYAVFNPKVVRVGSDSETAEEGCLSVPRHFGMVARPTKIILEGQDTSGKKIKIKAWGLLARIFQHEVDHLNGVLFIDACKDLHRVEITKPK